MQQKKQVMASLEHPAMMYGYIGTQSEAEHEEAVRQWRINFTSSLENGANDEFRYDKVVLLRNVNIRAYAGMGMQPEMQLIDLPGFHAGVVFMHGEYPVWLYLFEYADDMDDLLDEYPFNNFILQNGERYADAAAKAGIKFRIYDGKEAPEYPPSEAAVYSHYEGCCDGELVDSAEAVSSLADYEECAILSLPGWPNKELQDVFLEASARVIEQQLGALPEHIRELMEILCNRLVVGAPIVYKVPLPDMDYLISHIATGAISLEDHTRLTILVQNNMLFECELGGRQR